MRSCRLRFDPGSSAIEAGIAAPFLPLTDARGAVEAPPANDVIFINGFEGS